MMKILINKGMTMRTYKVVELVGCPLPQVIVGLHWSSTAAGEGLAWAFWSEYCTILSANAMFDRSTRFTFVEEESVLAPQFSFLRLPPSTAWAQTAINFVSVYSKRSKCVHFCWASTGFSWLYILKFRFAICKLLSPQKLVMAQPLLAGNGSNAEGEEKEWETEGTHPENVSNFDFCLCI